MKAVPSFIKPMLAKEVDSPFDDDDWLYELKWDGYRAIAVIYNGQVKLYSRNFHSFNGRYPSIEKALSMFKHNCIIDGEIVIMNKKGNADFGMLQNPADEDYARMRFVVFDILWLNGKDTTLLELTDRKSLLKELVKKNRTIVYNDHVENKGIRFFNEVIKKGHEGIIAKRKNSIYSAGRRSADWLKIKAFKTTEAIVVGYTKPQGSRPYFGSLLLAQYGEENRLIPIGMVGSGFNDALLARTFQQLQKIKRKNPIITQGKPASAITWVSPKLIAEIRYTERTRDGKLRHPVFLRWRTDKSVEEIVFNEDQQSNDLHIPEKDLVMPATKTEKKNKSAQITHPDKIYWPGENISKKMLADYYISIADYILPFLKNRPQSLFRNPGGIKQKGFFHKDAGEDVPEFVKTFQVYSELSRKEIDYIVCNNKATLTYLNNLGCIELNPWHSSITHPDKPDYGVIDLDPSSGNSFDDVITVARQFKMLLDKLGVKGYCKTSGSTGLHIYIPMGRKYDYEQVQQFIQLLCMHIEKQLPELTTTTRNLSKRSKKKVYLDFLQNRKGQTICSVYSVRPKKGAPVSMPLLWTEIRKGLSPLDFTIHNALKRIRKNAAIFKAVLGKGISMQSSLKKLSALEQ